MAFANTFTIEVKDLSKVEVKPDGTASFAVKTSIAESATPISLLVTGLKADSGVLALAALKFSAPAGTLMYFETSKPVKQGDFYTARLEGRFEIRM